MKIIDHTNIDVIILYNIEVEMWAGAVPKSSGERSALGKRMARVHCGAAVWAGTVYKPSRVLGLEGLKKKVSEFCT